MHYIRDNWKMWALLSVTLGLAPFTPQPHLFGKLKWIMGGGAGMSAMDYFDLLFHGIPWVILLVSLILKYIKK